MSSLGVCLALLVLVGAPEAQNSKEMYRSFLSEAAAVPCPGREGKIIISGIASRATNARTAVLGALDYVKRNMNALIQVLGKPRIDLLRCLRLRESGTDMTKDGHVDIILHVPPHFSASFLAPSMVIAIVLMLWRRPYARGCSVVGSFDTYGRLTGYPCLSAPYIEEARRMNIRTLVLSRQNANSLKEAARVQKIDLRKMRLTIVGCKDMMEVVRVVILGETLNPSPPIGLQN